MNMRPDPDRAAITLGSPLRLGGLALRNRIVMAPMTRECAPEGVPSMEMARYYGRRAEGGTGLIVTEGAAPNPEGRFGRNVPHLYGAAALQGWATVCRAAHDGGAAIFAQIWHVGAFSPEMVGMSPSLEIERLSPSGLAAPGKPFGRAMTTAEIERTIRDYGQAAKAAREAGFDGVEIHAAHGYLPDQFFWDATNRREDAFGGSPAARARFAAALITECKLRAGSDFPVSLRLSQWKQLDYLARVVDGPEALQDWLKPLVRAGVDLFHVSTRKFWEPGFAGNDETLAGWVRRLSGKPVIAVGSALLGTDFKAPTGKSHSALVPEGLHRITDGLREGRYDLMGFGRAALANPDLAQQLLRGEVASLRSYDRKYLDRLE